MAKFNPILGPLRGVIGASVFSHNKGGDYVRLRQAPTNPQSVRQMQVRNVLSTLAVAWSELTDNQRTLWTEFAVERPRTDSLGNSYTLTGLQMFCAMNCVVVDAGGTAIDEPPAIGVQNPSGPGSAMTVTYTDADTIEVTPVVYPPTGGRLVVWWNGQVGPGQNPDSRQAKIVGYSAVSPIAPVSMDLPYSIQDGETCKFWIGIIDSYGQKSELLSIRSTYTAP